MLFLGRCGRTDLYGGNKSTMFSSLMYFRDCLLKLPSEWLVFPGHQYPLDDGSNPMHICVGDLLQNNRSILEQSYEEFCKLEFLEFDDSLSVK